jgi:hypothetical protein
MSDLNFITCPDCKCQIPISEALSHQVEERLQSEFNEKIKDLEIEKKKILDAQKNAEKAFEERLEKEKAALTEKSRQYLVEQKEKMKDEVAKEARERVSLEMDDLKKQNEESRKRLEEQQKMELQLRQERRELEEKQKNMELDLVRRLDEEKQKMSLKIQEDMTERFKMQQLESEKKLSDMQKALEDAQRKASATSERFRGEVQELELEVALRSAFIYDEIREVPKGVNGADVIQEIKDSNGRSIGTIVWECKRTKAFNEDWVSKLKEDVIRVKGNIPVLVTQTLPEDIKTFGWRSGVWVTDFSSFIELATVLRLNLQDLRRVEKLNDGRDSKMSHVYNYLSSDEFRNKIVQIVETFKMMQDQLAQEKRAFQKQWAAREMQLGRMMEGTVSVVGDLQGIMGSSLPTIEGMDLPGLEL